MNLNKFSVKATVYNMKNTRSYLTSSVIQYDECGRIVFIDLKKYNISPLKKIDITFKDINVSLLCDKIKFIIFDSYNLEPIYMKQ